jgi:hypothetical protein
MKRRVVSEEEWQAAANFLLKREHDTKTLSLRDWNKLHRLMQLQTPRAESEIPSILYKFGWRKKQTSRP